MSNVDLNQLFALPMLDTVHYDPTGAAGRNDSVNLFGDLLKQANAHSSYLDAGSHRTADRDADRSPPPKAEKNRAPEKPRDADRREIADSEQKPAEKTASRTDEETAPAAEDAPSAPKDAQKAQEDGNTVKRDDPKDSEVKTSEQEAVKNKDKNKDGDADAKAEETIGGDSQIIAAELAAIQAAKPLKAAAEINAVNETAVETEPLQEVGQAAPQAGDSASNITKSSRAETEAALAASMKEPVSADENVKTAENTATAETPSKAMEAVAGDGKTKSKKGQNTVAAAKGELQTHNVAGQSQSSVSADQSSDTASAAAGKITGDAANNAAGATQASASMMQSVLDVLKNTDKSAKTEDVVGSVTENRTNVSAASNATSAVREGAKTSAAANSDISPQVHRAQFVQRVERAFAAMGQREGIVRLKLSPPELGVLKMEIGIKQGVMKARVEAETPAARNLLLENLPDLRERLAQQNIHIQQFDVDLMDHPPGGMPQQTFGQADSNSQQGNRQSNREKTAETSAIEAVSATAPKRAGMGGSLNVTV